MVVEEKADEGALARRGSSQVVVLLLWSTKYGRPSGVWRSSHPWGRGTVSEAADDGEVEMVVGIEEVGEEVDVVVVVVAGDDDAGGGWGRAGRVF